MWFARTFRKTHEARENINKIAPSLKMKPAVWSIPDDELEKLLDHVRKASDFTDTDKRYLTKLLAAVGHPNVRSTVKASHRDGA